MFDQNMKNTIRNNTEKDLMENEKVESLKSD